MTETINAIRNSKQTFKDYVETYTVLEERKKRLTVDSKRARGLEALRIERRISTIEDELYEIDLNLVAISRYINALQQRDLG